MYTELAVGQKTINPNGQATASLKKEFWLIVIENNQVARGSHVSLPYTPTPSVFAILRRAVKEALGMVGRGLFPLAVVPGVNGGRQESFKGGEVRSSRY